MGRSSPARIAAGLALALAPALGCGDRDVAVCGAGERAPSVVVIVADTLRADYVGRGSDGSSLSPTLDSFAADAVSFSSAYSQAPWTKPSVASLLTGLHPDRHGVMNHRGYFARSEEYAGADRVGALPADVETLAEAFARAGYQSAGFVANEWLAPGYGYEQGFDHYEHVPRDRLGAVFARAARWLSQRDPDRPFLLYLHPMEVHGPYDHAAPFVDSARSALGDGEPVLLAEETFAAIPGYLRASAWTREPGARDLREWRTRYGAGVVAFDAALAVFLRHAREEGWLDQTIVVVTSDHGEELFDHGGWDHGSTLFEEMLHVPLLVRLPGARDGGRTVDGIANLVDLKPSLLELAGVEAPAPEGALGRSLAPTLCGVEPDLGPRLTLASAVKHDPALYSVRSDRHKLVLDTRSGAGVLFDLSQDPGELRDVAAAQRETADALARELWREVVATREADRPVATAPIDPAMRARLEALGYVEPAPGR